MFKKIDNDEIEIIKKRQLELYKKREGLEKKYHASRRFM